MLLAGLLCGPMFWPLRAHPPHQQAAHRGTGGLQGLKGLLVAALLLHALSLKIALAQLLQEAAVGTADPVEQC